MSVDPEGRYIDIDLRSQIHLPLNHYKELALDLDHPHAWSKGLYVDEPNRLIITWNKSRVNFCDLSRKPGALVSEMTNLTEADEIIMDVKLFIDYRYFLTSTNFGNIYTWKFKADGKVQSSTRLIHNFRVQSGHLKAVPSIMPFRKRPNLFLSTSKDCTARIWSLQSFVLLYTFYLPGHIQFC